MSEISYTNNPTSKAKSRIIFDSQNIESNKETLEKEGLFFHFNLKENIDTRYTMLIIGPDDSPYVGGYYYFNCQLPDRYPFFPMKILSKTQGGGIRKHPNLYVNGKCCFSFLGTWQGPPWTACQNPKTVGISIRSVLTNNPITNEPGWENKSDSSTKLYETIIRYFNIRYAVIEILDNIPDKLKYFEKNMHDLFLKNYDKFLAEVELLKYLDKTKITSPVYSFDIFIDYNDLKDKLKNLFTKFSDNSEDKINNQINIVNNINLESNIDSIIENNYVQLQEDKNLPVINYSKNEVKKKNSNRKCPEESSSNYDIGTVSKGLDGNNYIVKKIKSKKKKDGSIFKKWILIK